MKKVVVIECLNKLSDEFSLEDFIERLIIINKIKKGRENIKNGKINTEEQAKAKLSKWLN
jgi:predicted transcriptional regulator